MKRSFLQNLILFLIVFVISNLIIIRPMKKRIENENNLKSTQKEIEKARELQKNNREKGNDIIIENDYLKIIVNTVGLTMESSELKKYKINVNSDKNVKLFDNSKGNFYKLDINWLSYSKELTVPNENSVWKAEKLDNKTIFSFVNKDGIVFKVIMYLDDKYILNVEQVIENKTLNNLTFRTLWQLEQYQSFVDISSFNGGIGYINNKLQEIKTKKLNKKNKEFDSFSWAGLTSKYWLVAVISDTNKINFLKDKETVKVQYLSKNDINISANSNISVNNKIFMGAKDIKILRDYQKKENLPLFDRSIDFGLFYIISKPMNNLLNFLNKIFGNFGLAIIVLTIIVKMSLYPTTKKSLTSMTKMKKAQPEIKRIQELYKNDKLKMQQEIVKLYKKYDFNPLSGIIPIFIQIPIFLSLYKVISVNIYMRQAPFFGYIKDLSIADPTTIFNLFGLLPADIRFKIGFLPCLMALTMYIQQKITERLSDQKNEKISDEMETANNFVKYMPLIFLFMFSGLPSGLILYWIFNNIITILQQLYIEKFYMKK